MAERIKIRSRLLPGDLGRIVSQHGELYAREYGLDAAFEGSVASTVGAAAEAGFPREREGVWIVERDYSFAGSIALTADGDTGILRWFLLDPRVRGRGLGRRLVGEVVAAGREHGLERVKLMTFSELHAAGHLYREAGFELQREDPAPRWGRDLLTLQYYELSLGSVAGAR